MPSDCIIKRRKLLQLKAQPFLVACVTHQLLSPTVITGIQQSQSLSWPKVSVKLEPIDLEYWFWTLRTSMCAMSRPQSVQVCLCCSRMFLQDKQQVAVVPSDNSWVPFVDTRLQEGETPAQYPSAPLSLHPLKLQIPIFKREACLHWSTWAFYFPNMYTFSQNLSGVN